VALFVLRPSTPVADPAQVAAFEAQKTRDAAEAEARKQADAKAAEQAAAAALAERNLDGDLTRTAVLLGQQARLDLPKTGPAKAVAVFFHGQNANVDTRMNEGWLNSLRNAGWAVASSDFHGSVWGNRDAVADSKELIKWAESQTGAKVQLFVGASMGGLTSLNTLRQPDVQVKCWYGTMPVVDLEKSGVSVPGAAAQLVKFVPAGDRSWANAAANLGELPKGTTYRVLASPDDTMVKAAENAAPLTAYLAGQGYGVTTLAGTGEHGSASHFNAADLSAFAAGCL
jgi:hypothetical protein